MKGLGTKDVPGVSIVLVDIQKNPERWREKPFMPDRSLHVSLHLYLFSTMEIFNTEENRHYSTFGVMLCIYIHKLSHTHILIYERVF